MTSYDAKDHGATARGNGQAKEPWVAPSLQIIALKSAENGKYNNKVDSSSAKFNKTRS